VFFMAVRPSGVMSPGLAGDVTKALRAVNADLKIKPRLASEQVGGLLAQDRLVAQLAIVTSVQALLLAAVGLYGVTAFTVHQRRNEMGIRLALGGTPAAVVRVILSRVMALLFAGLLIGCLLAVWTGSFVAPLLYGVGPYDPLTFLVAASGVALIGCLSALVPALRASRIDPMLPLRT
jgi:ABC-type antimicrobial peptide transport system permease subunit